MTTFTSFIVICVVWLIGTVWATLGVFHYNRRRAIYIDLIEGCLFDNMIFHTASGIFAFFIPTIITLVTYARILSIAHKRHRMAQNGELGQTNQVRNQRTTICQDLKNIRILVLVVGTFILCWGPLFTSKFHFFGLKLRNDSVSTIVRLLPLFSSICSPIIYACLDRTYRDRGFQALV